MKLEARRRIGTGKGAGRRIRNLQMIPAVMYGNGGDSVNLAVDPKAIKAILHSGKGRNAVFGVEVDGGESVEQAMLRDWQKDPVQRTLVHCDILRLDPSLKRTFRVPVRLTGLGPAEKLGAKIYFVTREVLMQCLPSEVPEALEVDTEELDMGGAIRLADVAAEAEHTILFTQNAPIVAASTGVFVEEEEEEEGEEGEEGAEGEEGEEGAEGDGEGEG